MKAALFSDEWFSELAAALSGLEPETDWPGVDLGITVDDAPQGPVRYTLHFGPSGAALEVGSVATANVTLVESFDTAQAIAEGAPIAELLADGRVTVRGDASSLVAAQRPLAALSSALGGRSERARNGTTEAK